MNEVAPEQLPSQIIWDPEGILNEVPHYPTRFPGCRTSCSHIPQHYLKQPFSTEVHPLQFNVLDSAWVSGRGDPRHPRGLGNNRPGAKYCKKPTPQILELSLEVIIAKQIFNPI